MRHLIVEGGGGADTFMLCPPAFIRTRRDIFYLPGGGSEGRGSTDEGASSRNYAR